MERRNRCLGQHVCVVSDLAKAISRAMELEQAQVSRIGMAALLRDIGKVAISNALLRKAGHHTTQERALLFFMEWY